MKFRIKYPNLTLLGLSIFISAGLVHVGVMDKVLGHLENLQYVGAFIAGVLFPITFTSPVAVTALYYMGAHYGIMSTVILGAIGAVVGDFSKDVHQTVITIAHPIHGHKKRHEALVTLFHTKPFHALAMFIGGVFILLPGPDEIGIAILSSYKMNSKKFILLSLVLNTASVWVVILAGARQFFGS